MKKPEVKEGQWIEIHTGDPLNKLDGYVFNVYTDGTLGVGYYQNRLKAVKEQVIWNDDTLHWEFKDPLLDGVYLRGPDEAIVKQGPQS